MTDSFTECRICFSLEGSKLISPCDCKGSCAFIHDHCLNTWVRTSGQMTCSSCNSPYSGEKKPKRLTRWRIPLTYDFLCFLTVSLAYLFLIAACLYFHSKFSQYLPRSITLVLYFYELFNIVGLTYTGYRTTKEIWHHNQEFVFAERRPETTV